METNPYQPPQAEILVSSDNANAEAIRKAHISHEASVKSVGVLFLLGGVIVTLAGFGIMLDEDGPTPVSIGVGSILLLLAAWQFWTGLGLRKLKPSARIPTAILSGIGLIGFPVGTIINGYIMYLVLCKKGATVLSVDYKQVIAQTPHVKYKTSIIVLILLGILIAALVFGLIAAFIQGSTR